MKNLKVVFMGTPNFAVPILSGLIKNYNVVLVVSQPDKEKDRKGNLLPTPIKKVAIENNIDVFQPDKIRDEYEKIIAYEPDIIITCAYGQIIPKEMLDYPKYGCINVHASLLPKLRGGAPIHRAIMNGYTKTGITIMYMDEKMDSGDIISQREISILDDDNLDTLYDKLSILGNKLLLETLPNIISGKINRIKQDENLVTYGYNISKDEEKINFNDKAINIHNKVRSLSSNPCAYCYFDNKRLKIYKTLLTNIICHKSAGTIEKIDNSGMYVSTGDYLIIIKELKLEGKNRCNIKEFLNGKKSLDLIGKVLK